MQNLFQGALNSLRGAVPQVVRDTEQMMISLTLEIARKLGVAPSEFVYLGDTNTDMQTAVAAGMFPVGALWGFRTADELIASGAKVLAERPLDLLVIVDGGK